MKKCILLVGMFLVCAVSMAQYRISIKGESNRFYMEDLSSSRKAEPYPQAYVMAKENKDGNIEVVTTMGASDGRPYPFSKIGGIPYTEFRDGNNEDATFASVQAVLDWFDDNTGFNSAGGSASSTVKYKVADYTALSAISSPTTGDVSIVTDEGIAGTFVYDSTLSATDNGGTIIDGWVRQYEGDLLVEWFGIKGDYNIGSETGTDNTTNFESLLSLADTINEVIRFGKGVFAVTAKTEGELQLENVVIRGAGYNQTQIYNTSEAGTVFIQNTDDGVIDVQGVHFSRFDYIFKTNYNLESVDIRNCKFTNNRSAVFYSYYEHPDESSVSKIKNIVIKDNLFEDTPGINCGSSFDNVLAEGNIFKGIKRDVTTWGSSTGLQIYGLRFGNAYSSDSSFTYDETQSDMRNVMAVNNTFSENNYDYNESSVYAIDVTGHNVVIANNTIRDIYDTAADNSAVDNKACAIYTKAYILNISDNNIFNCGSDNVLAHGAITIKGYEDGTDIDGSSDGIGKIITVADNTIISEIAGARNAIWLGDNASILKIAENTIGGYDYVYDGLASDSQFIGNTYKDIRKSIFSYNSSLPKDNIVIRDETIIDYKPVSTVALYYIKSPSLTNVKISKIRASIDLDDLEDSTFKLFTISTDTDNTGVIDNLEISNVRANVVNSSLTSTQYLYTTSSNININNGVLSDWEFDTDDSATWHPLPITNANYIDTHFKDIFIDGNNYWTNEVMLYDYTLIKRDVNNFITYSATNNRALTVDANIFDRGDVVSGLNTANYNLTITAGAGVTLSGDLVVTQNEKFSIYFTSATTAVVFITAATS